MRIEDRGRFKATCVGQLRRSFVFVPSMPNAKLIFQVAYHPHLANEILIQWQVHRLEVLDEEPRSKTDCDREDHRSPERNSPKKNERLVDEVRAGEEGIDDDPNPHQDRRSNNHYPCHGGPVSRVHTHVGIRGEDRRHSANGTEV